MSKLFFSMAFVSLLLFSGCSIKSEYKNEYIQSDIIHNLQKNKTERLIVLTEAETDDIYIKYSPVTHNMDTPLGHALSSLELPIGKITREVTYEFYNQYFYSTERSNNKQIMHLEPNAIIVKPKTINFSYALPVTNMGFTMTPHINFVLQLEIHKNGKVILSKNYDSGIIYGETSMGSSLYEDTSKAFHKGLFNLYKIINQDVIMALSNN
jgi:hypothetical protein